MIRMFLIPLFVLTGLTGQFAVLSAQCTDSLTVMQGADERLYLVWTAGSRSDISRLITVSGATHQEIYRLNPILMFRDLQPCDRILAPFDRSMLSPRSGKNTSPVWYKVRAKETVFSLTKRLFMISMEDFLKINQLESGKLKEGQIVLVGFLDKHAKSVQQEDSVALHQASGNGQPGLTGSWYYDEFSEQTDSTTLQLETQKGVAFWNKQKPDPNLFALHREAPLNSYIEITNPMFGRRVRAKVIGKIPPTYPDDICIIVSEGVARQLGAIDSRFYAEMSYVAQ